MLTTPSAYVCACVRVRYRACVRALQPMAPGVIKLALYILDYIVPTDTKQMQGCKPCLSIAA